MNFLCALILLVSLSFTSAAQVVLGTTYRRPSPPPVAPGQLTTFIVSGLTASVGADAAALPLPTTLGGVSAVLRQFNSTPPVAAPILSVHPLSSCNPSLFPGTVCNSAAAVTVQIPFELVGSAPGLLSGPNLANITFLEKDNPVASFDLRADTDAIHVITDCDALVPASTNASNGLCDELVTHADGSPVLGKPAVPGETVIIYAFGLGAVTPLPADGAAATGAAAVTGPFAVHAELAPNARPLRLPWPAISKPAGSFEKPAYAGLVPGSVGLYQVNVVIPPVPNDLSPCGPGVYSNLTVTLVGWSSTDGAAFCVAPSH